MNKKIAILTVFALFIIVCLSGCNEVKKQKNFDEEKLIGTWVNSELYNGSTREITYVFYSNNTAKIKVSYIGETFITDCEWRISNEKLIIDVFEPTESRLINDFSFSNNNNTLALTDSVGNITTFYRQ